MGKKLDEILVIDLECTCWDGKPPGNEVNEIIEIGLCTLKLDTLELGESRSILVKPANSTVSTFCTQLTSLTQEQVDTGISYAEACRVLKKEYASKDRTWGSWGAFDRRQFERQCASTKVGYPFGPTHLNIKNLFALAHGLAHEQGMDAALKHQGLELEGRHHRGVDDARNIARLLALLLKNSR